MKNRTTLFVTLLLASSGAVMAETSALEAAGKQVAKDAATQAAPGAVKGAESANQTLENAKDLKQSVETAPATAKEQAQEKVKAAAEEKLKQATPEEIKKGEEALKTGKETAKQVKGQVDVAPKSTKEAVKAVEGKTKQKAAEKALDLLQ
ncbi:MAG: hypothetical protein LUQ11_08480 [Methylococcaceae bacterium]|nr:hypothetical protein [Methylococcaceae bacterium]